jgi:hypothetical protein
MLSQSPRVASRELSAESRHGLSLHDGESHLRFPAVRSVAQRMKVLFSRVLAGDRWHSWG